MNKKYIFPLWGPILFSLLFFFSSNKSSAAVGFLSQTIDFDYLVVQENNYYHNGFIENELAASTISNQHSEYGINYLIRFKTGYHHEYFAIMLDYTLGIEDLHRYNQIDIQINELNQRVISHKISPKIFGQFEPFRVGIGYNIDIRKDQILTKQHWSIRPDNALSFYFHIYLNELWHRSPIGLGTYYEIAFNPADKVSSIRRNLFQSAGLSFNVNFNYLSQFQILFTYQRLDKDVTLYKVNNDAISDLIYKKYLVRYYLDYTFMHQILPQLTLRMGIGQLIYSDYESPALNLNIGFTYSFFRH